MKNLPLAFIALLLVASCKKDKETPKSGSADASVSGITLGDEKFTLAVPADGATIVLANAPRTVASDIKKVKVNIAAAANADIKIGAATFASGNTADFTSPVTFTVTAEDGTAKNYSVSITAYHAVSNPYGIYTVKHLVDAANELTASYLLKNNIDLPKADADGAAITGIKDYAESGWLPLDSLMGTFDGGNFSINNFYVKRQAEKAGFFAALGKTGVVKNLSVNGVSGTAAAGSNSGKQCTGILAGYSTGTIEKCYVAGDVSASSLFTSSSPSSHPSDFAIAGGLAGVNLGSISNSYAAGNVSANASANPAFAGGLAGVSFDNAISNSYAAGNVSAVSVSAAASAGGLAGLNGSLVSNSYAAGNVSASGAASNAGGLAGGNFGSSISNSYATGNVSSAGAQFSSAGGLTGHNDNDNDNDKNKDKETISNSYAFGNVSSSSSSHAYVGGLAGSGFEGIAYANCYRNSNATITKNSQTVSPDDASVADITPKTKVEMQTNAFKEKLNGISGTAWGRNDDKNDKLPFIIGVGAGK